MTEVYTPGGGTGDSKAPLDTTRCKASVVTYNGRWPHIHQCIRKVGVDGWCKQHHPGSVAARNKDRAATERSHHRKFLLGAYGARLASALEKIRDGDNDPRATASEVLAEIRWDELK